MNRTAEKVDTVAGNYHFIRESKNIVKTHIDEKGRGQIKRSCFSFRDVWALTYK